MKFEIKHRWTETTIYQDNAESFQALVLAAVKSGVDLRGAGLRGADLRGADLRGADLRGADLRDANLRGADLRDADLRGANLRGADLRDANLRGADLRDANLRGANLRGADLRDADLSGADLRDATLCDADLRGADLRDADLSGADLRDATLCDADLRGADLRDANLRDANLRGAKNLSELIAAQTNILPEGPIIGWKKCQNQVIVKLLIPAKARKSNALGRKCRAEFVKVLQIFGAESGISTYDSTTIYRKGETITCREWEEDRWVECGGGIHFFITRVEAESY